MIRISGYLNWSKTLTELIFNPCGEFWWSPEDPVSQIHSPHFLVGAPAIFLDFLWSVQMLKREQGAESNGKLPHLFIPSKTATLIPEFAVEDLPVRQNTMIREIISQQRLELWMESRSRYKFYVNCNQQCGLVAQAVIRSPPTTGIPSSRLRQYVVVVEETECE